MSRSFVALFWLLAFPAAAMAQTRVDLDRQKDFTLYKTFTVDVAPPVLEDGVKDVSNTLATNRLRDAVTRELQARGLEATDISPDLVVRVSSRQVERTELVNSGWGWGAYPWGWDGYWFGARYAGWGPYSDVWTYNYLEGTVTIDVIERDTGRLVYRGQRTREIGHNVEKHAHRAVHKALKKFPIEEIADRD